MKCFALATVAILYLVPTCSQAVEPGSPTVLRLRDGRDVEGEWLSAPSSAIIRLRSKAEGVVLESTFARDVVVSILPSPRSSDLSRRADVAATPLVRSRQEPEDKKPATGTERIRTLTVEAEPANWNGDAEPDGLLVRLIPLGDRDVAAAVSGEVTITLVAYVRDSYRPDRLALRPEPREIERASHLVRASDFVDGTAVYRLPYRRNNPSRDADIEPFCSVHVRLGVPTTGVFEAVAPVQLRAADPSFDRLPYFKTLRP